MIFSGSTSNSPKTKVVSSILFSTKPFCRLHSCVVSTHRVNIVVKYLQVKFLFNFARFLTFPAEICYGCIIFVSLQRCEIQIDLNFFFKLRHYEKLTFWNHLTRKAVDPFCGQKFPTKGRLKGFHSDKGSVEIRKSINLVCEDIGKTKIEFSSTDWYILLKLKINCFK